MFIKTFFGDFINLETGLMIANNNNIVAVFAPGKDEYECVLLSGDSEKCDEYMTELEKELAAFGKLVRVEVGD